MRIFNQLGQGIGSNDRAVPSIVGKVDPAPDHGPPTMRETGWNLTNIPPVGHPDVGAYFYRLFEDAIRDRNRLNIPQRIRAYGQLFRGRHAHQSLSGIFSLKRRHRLSIALLHANVTRTVANITARAPIAEVVQADGIEDGSDVVLTEKMRVWNNREEQQVSLATSTLNMEQYGITVEKAVWDADSAQGQTIPLDPLAWAPAPGSYATLNDMPYQIHIFSMPIEVVEAKYGVSGVVQSTDIHNILGEERREDYPGRQHRVATATYPSDYVPTSSPAPDQTVETKNALLFEVWIKDHRKQTVQFFEEADDGYGNLINKVVEREVPVYPGGIRVVTLTNNGNLVCLDTMNPNINPKLPLDYVQNTYLFSRFPFSKANSYEDTSSVWGYPIADIVGDINLEVDELWSSIINYLKMSMYPPLILPKDCLVPKSKVRYIPRLILEPASTQTSSGIRWLPMPAPPRWIFDALSSLISFFDRISQIEDADRGQAPGSVIAASAIQMLQERGAVLVRAKIRAVDHLVRERGRSFISFYQNFGVDPEYVSTSGGTYQVSGTQYINRKFNYVVESGSTVARTSSEIKQEAAELYKLGAIDRQALLQQINFPDWRRIVERMGESQLQQALTILVQAGLPQETARELYNFLVEDQGGPGDVSKATPPGGNVGQPGAPAQAGTPKGEQGAAK